MAYEHFEHTADLGLRVTAPTPEALFREAAAGLFAMIVAEPPPTGPARPFEFRIEGRRYDHLLFDWLHELLYTFDVHHVLLEGFEVRLDGDGLSATAVGRPFDPEDPRLLHEVKAITYHGLKVERTGAAWLAEVIVDI